MTSSQKKRTRLPPSRGKHAPGKGKLKEGESWAGGVAKHIFNPRDTTSRPRIDRRMISRPVLQEAPYDGSKSSKPTTQPAPQHDIRYPLVPATDNYPYWGTVPVPPASFPITNDANPAIPGRYPRQHPSFGPRPNSAVAPNACGSTRRRETVIPRRPVGATYRSRPSQWPVTMEPIPASPPRLRDFSNFGTAAMSKKEKRLGMADPAVWESVSRTLTQQHRLSSLVSPEPSPGPQSDAFDAPSRGSSQRRVLDRFTKDLQTYADATGARGRLPIIPSTATESRNTLHTVDELLPYHNEFQAAGLAVTSAEQSPERRPTRKERLLEISLRCSGGLQLDGKADGPENLSNGRGSGSSTIVPFAEQDGLSHLLVDELPPPKQKKSSPKKVLPWLHKKQQVPPTRLPQVQEDEPSMARPTTPASPSRAQLATPGPSGKKERSPSKRLRTS